MTLERGLPWKQDDPTCKNSFFLFLILLPCERARQPSKTVQEQSFLFLPMMHLYFQPQCIGVDWYVDGDGGCGSYCFGGSEGVENCGSAGVKADDGESDDDDNS